MSENKWFASVVNKVTISPNVVSLNITEDIRLLRDIEWENEKMREIEGFEIQEKVMKKKIFTALTLILILTLALTGCGKDDKKAEKKSKSEVAIATIKKIDTKDYFSEDMDKVKNLADETIKKLKKTDEKGVKEVLARFNEKFSKIPKKSATIKAFQDKLNNEISTLGDDKTKAEEVLKAYLEKIKKIKSKADLDKLSTEIIGKIEEATGKEIADIKVSEVTETAVKELPKNQVTASSKSNPGSSAAAKSDSRSSSSGTSGSTSKPSKPSKKWVVDRAAWTETINHPATYKTVTKYRPTWWTYGNGTKKVHYSEVEAYNLYVNDTTGEHASWGNGEDEAYTETVLDRDAWTETINHPEEGHWEQSAEQKQCKEKGAGNMLLFQWEEGNMK